MKTFYLLLANTTISGVINFTVWFAITFFLFLQTQSVLATGIVSGMYLILVAVTGIWFGSIVDNHKKKNAMMASSITSLILYAICFLMYLILPDEIFHTISSPLLWIFVFLLLVGIVVGNIRNIATPTTVSFLVPEDRRDKANGLVGTAFGVSFLITSVISGYLVGRSGMFDVLLLAVFATLLIIIHLSVITVKEGKLIHHEEGPKKIDLRGTIRIVLSIPGLTALILFNIINNLLGGVFMALMDAYGLSLVSVEMWGILWGILSTAFIIGGLLIAKIGLGKNPMRTLFTANTIVWTTSIFFTMYPSIFILALGMFIYLVTMPFIEASEQTVIQKVVPLKRQGRVFGFAQSIEQMASPFTAFLIGPITQLFFIPYMTTGAGAQTIGQWFGTGPSRGIALVFVITGIIGLLITILSWRSKYYHQLSQSYANA